MVSSVEAYVGFDDYGSGISLADLITLRYNGDVVAAVTLLAFGGVVFGFLALALVRLERLRRPTALDHLRHCVIAYALLCYLVFLLVTSYGDQGSLGYGLAVTGLAATGYAIFIDTLVLVRQRRRINHATSGGAV